LGHGGNFLQDEEPFRGLIQFTLTNSQQEHSESANSAKAEMWTESDPGFESGFPDES